MQAAMVFGWIYTSKAVKGLRHSLYSFKIHIINKFLLETFN